MRSAVACTCVLTMAVLAAGAAAQDADVSADNMVNDASPLLDVPFVPQTEALCGGAAAAMVLRYWGETGVFAGDFADLVDETAEGIRINRLARALAVRGWHTTPFTGTAGDVAGHLARGRPVIALIEEGPARHHYVVVVAWTRERVVVHDPARGPFRVVTSAEFERAWARTGRTTLLVLPPAEQAKTSPSNASTLEAASDRCSTPVNEAVRLARNADFASAEALLDLIARECPGSAQRELAGIRFLQKRWADAERLAGAAAAADAADMQAWQILAAARFVQGRETEALDAWNRRQEPRVDLTRVDGLDRTRHDVVTDIVEPAPGEILTSRELERARRRVGALPAMQTSRVVYAPRADGRAMIDVVVVEKPVLAHGWPSVTAMAVDAFVAREVRLQAANLTGDGELWMGSWRWWAGRPRVSFGLAVPRMFATSGLWRIDGSWEEASYRLTNDNSDVMFAQTERRGARVSFSDWATSDTRWEVRGGLDRWSDRGTHVFAGANIERRWVEDRLALRVDSTVWRAVDRPLTMMFASSGVSLRFRSAAEPGATWSGSAGLYAASAHAPLDRWPTADTGQVSHLLLRAHPLLDAGAIPTPDLSPRLAHATLELQRPLAIRLPTRIWWAAFVDAAQRGASAEHPRSAALVDVGLGLRVNVPGTRQFLRLDVARSLSDGRVAVSAGWQSAWGDQ